MCNCEISPDHIQDDAFGCGEHDHLITYRGRILGGFDYSALGLVELMQTWIASGKAYITIDSFRMQVDPGCPTQLDTINAPDCPLSDSLPPGIMTPPIDTTNPIKPTEPNPTGSSSSSDVGTRAGEVGGITIGVLVMILLVALILLILGIFFYKGKFHTRIHSSRLVTAKPSTINISNLKNWFLSMTCAGMEDISLKMKRILIHLKIWNQGSFSLLKFNVSSCSTVFSTSSLESSLYEEKMKD